MIEGVTSYKGLSKYYFIHLLQKVIEIGQLRETNKIILDFGCGLGRLKEILGEKVIGYDVISELSDVENWEDVDFDILVANQVFYTFDEKQLHTLLEKLCKREKEIQIIVGVSKQGALNNIGKFVFGKPDAHSSTKLLPSREKEILLQYCILNKAESIPFLADIYLLEIDENKKKIHSS